MINELVSVNYDEIERGVIYHTAIPFSEKRPLGIIDENNNRLVEDKKTFKGKLNEETGKIQSEVLDIIINTYLL